MTEYVRKIILACLVLLIAVVAIYGYRTRDTRDPQPPKDSVNCTTLAKGMVCVIPPETVTDTVVPR